MTLRKLISTTLYLFLVLLLFFESIFSGLIISYTKEIDNSYEKLIFLKELFSFSDTIYWHIVLGIILVLAILPLAFSILSRTGRYSLFKNSVNLFFLLTAILSALFGFLMVRGGHFYFLQADLISQLHSVFSFSASLLFIIFLILFFIGKNSGKSSDGNISTKPFRILVILLLVSIIFAIFLDSLTTPIRLTSKLQNRRAFVDGQVLDIEWMGVDEIIIPVHGGANQAGEGTVVRLKSFNNGKLIYFLLRWKDETRSLNRHLRKTKGGWIEIKSDYRSSYGESRYWEDQIALSFHKSKMGCLKSCHFDSEISAGRHYTNGDTADVWFWKAVSTNAAKEAEDGWWGELADEIKGGVHVDSRAGGGAKSNLNEEWQEPYFLPKYFFVKNVINIVSNTYVLYSVEADSFQIGIEIPAVAVSPSIGDVSDVRAAGVFRGGEWTVEISRQLNTGSPFDLALRDVVYLGIAVFDNAEKHHAYHLRAVELIIEID